MPEVGIQNFYHTVRTNSAFTGFKSYSGGNPTVGARLMYFSNRGHGPYIGIRVGDMSINFYDSTSNRITGISLYRFEAGYQWLTKPIYFKNIWNNNISRQEFEKLPTKGLAFQLMPSIGLSYTKGSIEGSTTTYGNEVFKEQGYRPNFGISSRIGVMFSKDGKQLFMLSGSYTKGFGNLYSTNYNSGNTSATQTTNGSNFHFSLGMPITIFGKKK